jgi:hypothetical protein
MAVVARRWEKLHDVVFDLDIDVPTLEPEPETQVDDEDEFLNAVRSVAKGDSGGLLSVRQVRERSSLTKAEFDTIALALQRSGKIVLHAHDFPASLTAAERASLIDGPRGIYYVGLALPTKSR